MLGVSRKKQSALNVTPLTLVGFPSVRGSVRSFQDNWEGVCWGVGVMVQKGRGGWGGGEM